MLVVVTKGGTFPGIIIQLQSREFKKLSDIGGYRICAEGLCKKRFENRNGEWVESWNLCL